MDSPRRSSPLSRTYGLVFFLATAAVLPRPSSGFAGPLPRHHRSKSSSLVGQQLRCRLSPTSPQPLPPSGDHAAVSRRSALVLVPVLLSAPALAAPTAPPAGDLFTDSQFQIFVPKGFFKSRRKVKEGTLFTSGNLKTAEIVSVQKLSTERLLMDAGVVPSGDLSESWETSIGKPEVVARLLAAARDNDAKNSAGVPSKVEGGSVSADGKTLRFRMLTEMSTQKDPIRRVTVVRAELLPDRSYLAAWGSCLEEDFGPETRARLEYATNSLVPRTEEVSDDVRRLLK